MIMKGGNANLTVSQALKDIVSDPTILITHQWNLSMWTIWIKIN